MVLNDNTSNVTNTAFTFTNNTEYTLEILYLAGGAVEIRAWASSGSRPSSATLSQAARSVTAVGTYLIVSFNTPAGSPTMIVDNLYLSLGSNAVTPMTAPSGYLENTGEPVSRSTYSGIFAVTGTLYGIGDGSTTFNLPQDWPVSFLPTVIKT